MRLRNNSGLSLVEMMVALGLASIASLGVMSLNAVMKKNSFATNSAFQADTFRKQIVDLLQNPTAWKHTLNAASNTTFSCIQSGVDCGPARNNGLINQSGVPTIAPNIINYMYEFSNTIGYCGGTNPNANQGCNGGFDVYDAAGNLFYAAYSDPTAGFDNTGQICSSTNPSKPGPGWTGTNSNSNTYASSSNPQANLCPYRLVLYWRAICNNNAGNCLHPAVQVIGYTLYAPKAGDQAHKLSVNTSNYSINLILSSQP